MSDPDSPPGPSEAPRLEHPAQGTEKEVGNPSHDRTLSRQAFTGFETDDSSYREDEGPLPRWDATDRHCTLQRLEEARLQADHFRERAEAASRAKDEFIAIVSHELRTPLQAVLTWAAVLQRADVPANLIQEGLTIIERSARSQQKLIEDLLDVSRMISGKLRLSKRPTALIEEVALAVEDGRAAAQQRQVALDADLDPEVGVVAADPDRLQQVLANLLNNAVKFTPSGGRIAVRLWRRGELVEMRVEDTGAGIRPELLPHVFDRFRQGETGTTRQYGGLGLGLSIAKQIVELHGGQIQAASEGEGRGAVFTATLPLPTLADHLASEPEKTVNVEAALRGRHVLLVDDSPETVCSIGMMLREAGAEVTTADTAQAALESLAVGYPDLLMSDIAMPGCDGYELIRQIRAREKQQGRRAVPALALTAFARHSDRQRALEAGYQEHLAKPVEPGVLVETLARLLSGRE